MFCAADNKDHCNRQGLFTEPFFLVFIHFLPANEKAPSGSCQYQVLFSLVSSAGFYVISTTALTCSSFLSIVSGASWPNVGDNMRKIKLRTNNTVTTCGKTLPTLVSVTLIHTVADGNNNTETQLKTFHQRPIILKRNHRATYFSSHISI